MKKEMKAAAAQNETKKDEGRRYVSYFLETKDTRLELLKVQEIKGCMGLVSVRQGQKMGLPKRARKKISGN